MRFTRIIASFVFATLIIFTLTVNSFASGTLEQLFECYDLIAYYSPLNSTSGKTVSYNQTYDGEYSVFDSIPHTIVSGNYEYSLNSMSFYFQKASKPWEIEFEYGYIYTYNFEIKCAKINNPNDTYFKFGVTNYDLTKELFLADVEYTYSSTSGYTTYHLKSVVYVGDDFNSQIMNIDDPEELVLKLEMVSEWSSAKSVRCSSIQKKSVGEAAYYQASLDAINNLPQTEYDYIYNHMPDSEGDVAVIQGEIDDMMVEVKNKVNGYHDMFVAVSHNEPMVYMPRIRIPILDIDLDDTSYGSYVSNGYFYPMSYLNTMNPEIVPQIEIVVTFLRFICIFTFATVGVYKMLRIEWWL